MSTSASSSAGAASAVTAQSPARSSGRLSFLPDFRPLQTISANELARLEDQLNQRLALDQEPEEAEEVSETTDLDAAREDRLKPLAFTEPRHHEEIKGCQAIRPYRPSLSCFKFLFLCFRGPAGESELADARADEDGQCCSGRLP